MHGEGFENRKRDIRRLNQAALGRAAVVRIETPGARIKVKHRSKRRWNYPLPAGITESNGNGRDKLE